MLGPNCLITNPQLYHRHFHILTKLQIQQNPKFQIKLQNINKNTSILQSHQNFWHSQRTQNMTRAQHQPWLTPVSTLKKSSLMFILFFALRRWPFSPQSVFFHCNNNSYINSAHPIITNARQSWGKILQNLVPTLFPFLTIDHQPSKTATVDSIDAQQGRNSNIHAI